MNDHLKQVLLAWADDLRQGRTQATSLAKDMEIVANYLGTPSEELALEDAMKNTQHAQGIFPARGFGEPIWRKRA